MKNVGWLMLGLALLGTWSCDEAGRDARATGSSCAWGRQCAGRVCIGAHLGGRDTGWTGGMCTERCLDGNCPAGQVCADLGDGLYCLPGCAAAADCREAYVCNPVLGACLPDCTLGWDCGDDFLCGGDGLCVVDWPELAPVGGPCDQDADCSDGWCLEETGGGAPTGWSGGACTVPCGPGGLCPAAAGCMVLEGEGWCLPRCQGPGGPACRDGYVCDPFMHVCVPSCQNAGWDCGEIYPCREDGVCGLPAPPGG
jgi:hypothetical protein